MLSVFETVFKKIKKHLFLIFGGCALLFFSSSIYVLSSSQSQPFEYIQYQQLISNIASTSNRLVFQSQNTSANSSTSEEILLVAEQFIGYHQQLQEMPLPKTTSVPVGTEEMIALDLRLRQNIESTHRAATTLKNFREPAKRLIDILALTRTHSANLRSRTEELVNQLNQIQQIKTIDRNEFTQAALIASSILLSAYEIPNIITWNQLNQFSKQSLATSLEIFQGTSNPENIKSFISIMNIPVQYKREVSIRTTQLKLIQNSVLTDLNDLSETLKTNVGVMRALDDLGKLSALVGEDSASMTQLLGNKISAESNSKIGAFLAGLGVLSLLGMLIESMRQGKARLEMEERVRREEERRNERNQEAILRLLDELADLGEGDLTVQTTVTEDFTGAIADSINFTIDQLRSLVSTINGTAVKVSGAAQKAQATAMQLADASEHQTQEIAGASAAMNEIAASIDQVSSNAAESSAVAEKSVSIAKKGAEMVRNTIRGMDTIRQQIQETAKRIKRLGESSQEIGDIVSLITDIADQTNILALNAAIQASMAGDAGKGFAVVADEVQRLAERASGATKQIEDLVKTIQTDTNEAVISMEQTTAEVVKGTDLAHDAGSKLEEIEAVSSDLAALIQNISNASKKQAASANHISNTMNVIREITSKTSLGTTATTRSIGNLAELAVQMRKSVAGFKLPSDTPH